MPTAPLIKPTEEVALDFVVAWLPPHKVVVHDNPVNTYDEVIAILMKAVPNCTVGMAIAWAIEVDSTGAAVVFVGDLDEASEVASVIRTIGIKVTCEPA